MLQTTSRVTVLKKMGIARFAWKIMLTLFSTEGHIKEPIIHPDRGSSETKRIQILGCAIFSDLLCVSQLALCLWSERRQKVSELAPFWLLASMLLGRVLFKNVLVATGIVALTCYGDV